MFRGFFQSKKWQNRLISAGVTSLGSGVRSSQENQPQQDNASESAGPSYRARRFRNSSVS